MYYASRRLSAAEKNYSTTERQTLRTVYSINKLWHYLLGHKFTCHVDHLALLYLINKQALTGRLARWMLLLQEFDFQIQHRPGVQHVIADYLSRVKLGEPAKSTYDDLLDVGLFSLTMVPDDNEDEWFWETGPSGWDENRMIEGSVVTSPTGWKGHICEYVPESPSWPRTTALNGSKQRH